MKYILGIDTTFHVSGVSLIDENGKVVLNEKIETDFTDENAVKFFNFHNRNVLSLAKPILEKYSEDIFLISASSENAPFHSMPVGAIIANTLSYFLEKKLIGVSHRIAHLYSNWLDRNSKDFIFPIVSLNISGGHSDIYLIKSHGETEKVSDLIWREEKDKFNGLGSLFDVICQWMNIRIGKGEGGVCLKKMALQGKPKYSNELSEIDIRRENNDFKFINIDCIPKKLNDLGYYSLSNQDDIRQFQNDFALSVYNVLFDLLIISIEKVARETKAKEIHLTGGISADEILDAKLKNFCKNIGVGYKAPLKKEYCGDNGAMTAICGYYQWKNSGPNHAEKFLNIKPSTWYYKYYAKYFG